ncbi:Uncharacterised protein [uncultured archaeon]|nr:Uncharacterised protein [uncultured archaeon]
MPIMRAPTSLTSTKEQLIHQFISLMKLDGMGGFNYQRKYFFHPIIGDMELREWGSVMADYMNAKIGAQKYSYVDFAWTGPEEKFSSPFSKAKLPTEGRRK